MTLDELLNLSTDEVEWTIFDEVIDGECTMNGMRREGNTRDRHDSSLLTIAKALTVVEMCNGNRIIVNLSGEIRARLAKLIDAGFVDDVQTVYDEDEAVRDFTIEMYDYLNDGATSELSAIARVFRN